MPTKFALELVAIGSATGIVIPDEMLERMKVGDGDMIYAVETTEDGYGLMRSNASGIDKMEKADEILRRYRNALHLLAKS
jgi:bifunctional DNA-binding transcriptional regulator/antitoxin component of YhaV-PrlF toxin-antitoxin module